MGACFLWLFRRSLSLAPPTLLSTTGGTRESTQGDCPSSVSVRGRRLVSGGAVVLALTLLALVLLQQQRSQASERAVTRIAGELRVPPEWSLISESSKPARLFCFSGGCPSVTRRWAAPGDVSTASFTATYSELGWPLRLEDDCEPATAGQVGRRSCVASGEVDGWPVSLVLQPSKTAPGTGEVALFVG